MTAQVDFLADLHTELVGRFGDELGTALLGQAASELFAGPQGVCAMFDQRTSSKDIPAKRIPK